MFRVTVPLFLDIFPPRFLVLTRRCLANPSARHPLDRLPQPPVNICLISHRHMSPLTFPPPVPPLPVCLSFTCDLQRLREGLAIRVSSPRNGLFIAAAHLAIKSYGVQPPLTREHAFSCVYTYTNSRRRVASLTSRRHLKD